MSTSGEGGLGYDWALKKLEDATRLRKEGNQLFTKTKSAENGGGDLLRSAEKRYTDAIVTLPPLFHISCYPLHFRGIQDAHAFSLANRALCYLKLGEPGRARVDCTQALFLKPTYCIARYRRAMALVELAKLDSKQKPMHAINLYSQVKADLNLMMANTSANIQDYTSKLQEIEAGSAAASSSEAELRMEDRLLARARRSLERKKRRHLVSLLKKEAASLQNAEKLLKDSEELSTRLKSELAQRKVQSVQPALLLNADVLVVVCSFLDTDELYSFSSCRKSFFDASQRNIIWRPLFESRWFSASSLCTQSQSIFDDSRSLNSVLEAHQVASIEDAANAVEAAVNAALAGTSPPRGTWKRIYKGFLFGLVCLNLQVFNREIKRNLEFAMSCYTAKVTYRRELDRDSDNSGGTSRATGGGSYCYHATYDNDGRGIVCESIEHRQIREVPRDIASLPSTASLLVHADVSGGRNFQVGEGVEIQWRRQQNHPFGWWYGVVEKIWQDTKEETGQVGDVLHVSTLSGVAATPILIPDNGEAVEVLQPPGQHSIIADLVNAHLDSQRLEQKSESSCKVGKTDQVEKKLMKITVVFPQYYEDSPWRRVTVVLGAKHTVRSMGGYVGGIRLAAGHSASPAERSLSVHTWEQFMPPRKIL